MSGRDDGNGMLATLKYLCGVALVVAAFGVMCWALAGCAPLPDRKFGPGWQGPGPIMPPSWTNQAPAAGVRA